MSAAKLIEVVLLCLRCERPTRVYHAGGPLPVHACPFCGGPRRPL